MYKRKDGLYETSRKVNGKKIMFRGKTIAEVNKKILEYDTSTKQGRKFPVICDEWLEQKEKEIRNATLVHYTQCTEYIKNELTDYVGSYKPLDIKRFLSKLESKEFSKQTIQGYFNCLKQIFAFAVLTGDIDINPCQEVKLSRNLPQGKRNALTEEQEQLVANYRGEDWFLGVMLLYTGCRRGEIMALTWQDIDLDKGTITINKKVDYSHPIPVIDDRTKNENGMRTIPIFYPLRKAIEEYGINHIGLVFSDRNGNIVPYSELYSRWIRYTTRVGIVGVVMHQFRHSFSTLCFESGIDVKSASAFLGDSEQVMNAVYTQLRQSVKMSSAEQLSAYLEMKFMNQEKA